MQYSNIFCTDTRILTVSSNSTFSNISSLLIGNTVDVCLSIGGSNEEVTNAYAEGGNVGIAFAGSAVNCSATGKAVNNFQRGVQMSGAADSLTASMNMLTPSVVLESTYTAAASYSGIDFNGAGAIIGGSLDLEQGQRGLDFRSACDNSLCDGLKIINAVLTSNLVRISNQANVTCKNMTFPNGTTSVNAFNIATATNFVANNNYALSGTTLLTGA